MSQSVIGSELETGAALRSVDDAVTVGALAETDVLVLPVGAGVDDAGVAGAGLLAATTEAGSVGINVAIDCAACGSSTE